MIALACFEESGSWWFLAGFSDNVSHILVGAHHGCCSRAVTRGLDRRVLDSATRGLLLVLGGNPLHGSDALDSRMGACLWALSLGQHAISSIVPGIFQGRNNQS
jgi:hypothetical protein